jgi:MHS family citrate/tricarballylate:H+ symporter-like MFS transporter
LGRKAAMILSFWLMGVAITGLALTPGRATIGVAAPVLAVVFRMLQGFALGGEVGPTTAFLLESAPPERRGFYTSFQYWTQNLSIVTSGLVGFGLARMLSEEQLQDFGWRIAFVLGAAIVPFGLMLRRRLPETFHVPHGGMRERIPLRPYLRVAVLGLVMLACATIGAFILDYMTTYAITALHMPARVAFGATIVVGLCGLAFDLVSGALSDRFGRKPVMLVPGILLLISIVPAFRVIAHYRTTAALLGVSAGLSSLFELSVCPILTWLTESLPAAIRSSSVAIVYAVAIAIFGGTTQFGVTWLIKVTRSPLAPAWYWTVAAVIGLTAMSTINESAPRKLAAREAAHLPSTLASSVIGTTPD